MTERTTGSEPLPEKEITTDENTSRRVGAGRLKISLRALLIYTIVSGACIGHYGRLWKFTKSVENEDGLQGQVDAATEMLQQPKSHLPKAYLYMQRAHAHAQMGDATQAEEDFERARKVDPHGYAKHPPASDFAETFAEQGDYKKSIELFESMLNDCPEAENIHFSYANMLATSRNTEIRDPRRALALAERAAILSPIGAESAHHQLIADAHAAGGDLQAALASVETALKMWLEEHPDCSPGQAEHIQKLIELYKNGQSRISNRY